MNDNENKYQIVNVACRRSKSSIPGLMSQSSADGVEQHCDSRTAYKLTNRSPGVVTFKCTKCGYTWNVSIGGAFNI